ncbi:unnamed protein product [Ectocarpus sp. 8 AP-2014]
MISSLQPTGRRLCLDAFEVALNQASDGKPWYTSIVHLQLASLEFCATCRRMPMLRVTVEHDDTPTSLWTCPATCQTRGAKRRSDSRVPLVRARSVVWNLPSSALRNVKGDALSKVRTFALGHDFNDDVGRVAWPKNLKKLGFGRCFNHPVERLSLPVYLQSLSFSKALTGQQG